MARPSPEEQEQFAELLLDNVFRCQCCKRLRNRNRMKKVMGFTTWRIATVCGKCFEDLNLAEV